MKNILLISLLSAGLFSTNSVSAMDLEIEEIKNKICSHSYAPPTKEEIRSFLGKFLARDLSSLTATERTITTSRKQYGNINLISIYWLMTGINRSELDENSSAQNNVISIKSRASDEWKNDY